jgi:hypothetical protein
MKSLAFRDVESQAHKKKQGHNQPVLFHLLSSPFGNEGFSPRFDEKLRREPLFRPGTSFFNKAAGSKETSFLCFSIFDRKLRAITAKASRRIQSYATFLNFLKGGEKENRLNGFLLRNFSPWGCNEKLSASNFYTFS